MTKVIKKWFVAILACFTVFLFAGIFTMNTTDNKEVKAEGVTELTIKSITYGGVRSNGVQLRFDIVFEEDVDISEILKGVYGEEYSNEYGSVPLKVNDTDPSQYPVTHSFLYDAAAPAASNAIRLHISANDYSTIESLTFLKGTTIACDSIVIAESSSWVPTTTLSTDTYKSVSNVSFEKKDLNMNEENIENEVKIGISRVYFYTKQDGWPPDNRPARFILDVVFDYNFPERGTGTGVSGVEINGKDVEDVYGSYLDLSAQAEWADSSCSAENTFRLYAYAEDYLRQLRLTEAFQFEINGITYKLDREYNFNPWALQANYGPVDGVGGPMLIHEDVPVQESLPEVKVTGVEVRGFRDNDLYFDVTFDKDLQKSESSFFMDNIRVNGQEPYIGSVNGSNTRYYPYVQYAEETANRVRLFINVKAADYGFIGNDFNSAYTREINTITILAGFKVVLADGTVAQVKADANYVALATIASGNGVSGTLLPENVLAAVQNVLSTLHTDGASIKVSGIQGLRFMNVVDATAKAALDAVANVTYGTVLTNTEIGTADVKADVWYDDAQTQYTATIKGFTTNEHYNLVFTATAYIDVQLASGKVMRFTATTSESRSIAYVANAAIDDYQTSYNEADGYVYEVEAGKFYKTDFTTEQLAYLRGIAATYVA